MPDLESTFRRLALELPGAVESSHMGAPDFRLDNRIFATLAFRARGLATLKLTPDQQASFLADLHQYTEPAPGGWGRRGMTLIRLDAPEDILRGALSTAFHQVQSKQAPAPARKNTRPPAQPPAPPRKRRPLK